VRLLAAFIRHELRIERRSLRFRAFAVGYVLLGCVPAVTIHLRRERLDYAIGGATYASATLTLLPLLSVLLAALLSMDGISRERGTGAWTTATLSGVTNSGYLLRRWVALLALLLPLTAIPLLVAAGLAMADGGAVAATNLAPFFGPWLLHVVPWTAAASALALGLGTIGGSAVGSFLLALLVFGVVPAVGNEILNRFRISFATSLIGLDVVPARWTLMLLATFFEDQEDKWRWTFPLPETEAGFDLRSAAEQNLAEGLLAASAASAALGLAVLFLRRTRPDVRPQRIRPDHPLRNFLISFGRLREQYTPDPKPAPADRVALACALALAAGAVGLKVERSVHYERLAERRWRAETGGKPAPMAVAVVPEAWRIEGRFDAAGSVALAVRGTLKNSGGRPEGHLAFTLNPGLSLTAAVADRGRVSVGREWDRLAIEVDPPIPPGGSRELRFRLAGRPRAIKFNLPPWEGGDLASFAHSYEKNRNARLSHDRTDLSLSYRVPAISGLRIDLAADELTPVPRYTTWAPLPDGNVADEVYFPLARLEIALSVPRDLLVADSCGGLSDPDDRTGGAGRLNSRCTLSLPELAVRGGRQRLLPEGAKNGTAVAVFPAHRAAGELHLGFFAGSSKMMDEAWPGVAGGGGRLVILEWPADEIHDRSHLSLFSGRYRDPFQSWVTVIGNLAFLGETDLIATEPLPPERLAAEIVSSRLARRRRFAPDESLFFRQLLRTLVLGRLGLGPQSGAVVGPLPPQLLPAAKSPAVHPESYSYWNNRFPALIAALGRRAGAEALRSSVEELLSPESGHAETPATFAEFAVILERRSERDVTPMIRDFFLAGKLPELVLEGVDFQPAGSGWRVTGRVHNLGDGEALCRLVLTTELGPVETEVRVGTAESTPFALATAHRPQGVFLDPDQECHRLVRLGLPRDRVFLQGVRR
jgi:ABC-type transport system involved in multi-copper enzyme maturation permease subunit